MAELKPVLQFWNYKVSNTELSTTQMQWLLFSNQKAFLCLVTFLHQL